VDFAAPVLDPAVLESLNRGSAAVLGWSPSWFGLPEDEFGSPLTDAICLYQHEWQIAVDGWCDASTYRRVVLERQLAGLEEDEDDGPATTSDFLIFNGEPVLCAAPCVTMGEEGAQVIERKYRSKKTGKTKHRYGTPRDPDDIDMAIIHWPVTSSVKKTRYVLEAKGISSNLAIDWKGVVYQMVDLACPTWHAGPRTVNRRSIGIDLQCEVGGGAKTDKINRRLVAKGRPPRPIIDGVRINGWRPKPFLGMYPDQITSLHAVLATLASCSAMPLLAPAYVDPENLRFMDQPSRTLPPGVYHHAEVKKRKWDTAGVDLHEACAAASEIVGG
jgi:hypothetical protein